MKSPPRSCSCPRIGRASGTRSGGLRWPAAPLLVALVVAPTLANPAAAQPWVGLAGLGVRVTGDGGPLADAEIRIFYLGDQLRGGPAPVYTDAEGQVEISGLAEGPWFVRVRHPSYMSYEAELEIAAGRKPRELMVARRKEGDSVAMNKVRFFKVEGRPAAQPRAEGQKARAATLPPPERAPAAPAPAKTTGTRTGTEVAAPPRAAPAEASERSVPPAVAPPAPVSAPAPAAAQPAVAGATPPERDTAPAPAEPVSPFARFLRNPRDGTCFDCRPGEWAVSAEGPARATAARGTACPDLHRLADDVLAGLGDLGGYAGPLLDPDTGEPWAMLLDGSQRSRLSELLAGSVPSGSACQLVALRLPDGARFVGFQVEALDSSGAPVPCLPGEACAGSESRWAAAPVVARGAGGTVVLAGFENRNPSGSAGRPRLTVYFVPRSDWRPTR